ncbi:MAG: hypothetical protein GC192_18360 [Bacteroidetes bacterium]|nr:hypothetical protein [Bacteroidota bacterium]
MRACYLSIIIAALCSIITILGCSGRYYIKSKAYHAKLSNDLIFSFVNLEGLKQTTTIPSKIYCGPKMTFNPVLFPNKDYGFRDTMYCDLLLSHYPLDTFNVIIPDSLKWAYSYFSDSIDIATDTSIVFFVSPLLATKKKHIYLQQRYAYLMIGDDELRFRIQDKGFNKFEIKGKKVRKLDPISFDFTTFGKSYYKG